MKRNRCNTNLYGGSIMKQKAKKGIAMILCLAMVLVTMTGCGDSKNESSKTDKSESGEKQLVFSYDGNDVYLDEAWMYCQSVASYYQNYYSSIFTSDDVWNMDYPLDNENTVTFSEAVKRQAMDQLRLTKVIVSHADEYKVELTKEEESTLKDNAKTYLAQISDDIKKEMGITEDTLYTVYKESTITNKIMDAMGEKEGIEISDEDARVSTAYSICFKKTKTDESGNAVDMTEEEKAAQQALAQQALEKAQGGEEMATIASDLGVVDSSGEKQFTKDSNLGDDLYQALLALNDGDVYSQVVDQEDGYYVLKMISLTDEEATATNKQTLESNAKQELLDKQCDTWTADKSWDYTTDCKQEYMDKIVFSIGASNTTEDGATQAETTEAATEAAK